MLSSLTMTAKEQLQPENGLMAKIVCNCLQHFNADAQKALQLLSSMFVVTVCLRTYVSLHQSGQRLMELQAHCDCLTLNGIEARSLSNALCLSLVTMTMVEPLSYVSRTLPCNNISE